MNTEPKSPAKFTAALALCALLACGCAGWRTPRIDPSGDRIFLPPEAAVTPVAPILPGVPGPQEGLTISPGEIIAPVGSEVIVLGTVTRANGTLWPHQRVEWMLAEEGAGEFVALGDRDCWHPLRLPRDTPRKLTNHYVIGSTSTSTFTINRGTLDTSDDVAVQKGQSWVSVTSPVEGTSRVTAFAPAVTNWDLRKVTASIHWVDAQWVFPPPAINPVGTSHVFTTTVSRHSNNTPLAGWIVRYQIIGGPPAGFGAEGLETIDVVTDALGQASAEIRQTQPQAGVSRVGISVIRPPQGGLERQLVLGTGTVTKTWTSPDIAVRAAAPAAASLGSTVTFRFDVTNPGDLPTRGVTATSDIPAGLSFVSANPTAELRGNQVVWNLSDLGPRETRPVELNLRADQLGSASVCASVRTADGLNASDCGSTTITAPSLEVRINGPQTAPVGSTVRYEVTVANLSQVVATGLTITDQFDPGFEHAAAQSRIQRDLEDIEPGQSRSIFVTFRVAQPGELCHTVEVAGAGGVNASARACLTATPAEQPPAVVTPPPVVTPEPTQPQPAQPQPTTPPAVQGRAAMEVTKRGPQQKRVGETAEFFIEIRNTGETPLTNLRIVDTYQLALDPVDATAGFTVGREELVWQMAQLAPGETYRLQVNCQCVAPAAQACNRITVYSDQRPPIADEACLEIFPQQQPPTTSPSDAAPPTAQQKLLNMTIADTADPVNVGQDATYRIFITNQGAAPIRNVQLTVTLPAELQPLPTGTAGPVRATFNGQIIRFEPVAEMREETDLRPADTLSFTVVGRASRAGLAKVVAEVTAETLVQPIRVETTTQVQ